MSIHLQPMDELVTFESLGIERLFFVDGLLFEKVSLSMGRRVDSTKQHKPVSFAANCMVSLQGPKR